MGTLRTAGMMWLSRSGSCFRLAPARLSVSGGAVGTGELEICVDLNTTAF